MISTYKHGKITWLDLDNPTQQEVRDVTEQFGLNPVVANDLLTPSLRPSVESYGDHIYLILHFPVLQKGSDLNLNRVHEVDFILGKNFIITNRYTSLDALHTFSKTFEVDSILDKSQMSKHAGFVFFYMMQNLYKSLFNKLAHVKDLLRDAEEEIFSGREKEMVIELSQINRMLLNFKSAISMHKEILQSLVTESEFLYGPKFKAYLKNIMGEYLKVEREVSDEKEYLDELRDTNNSLLSTKQNEIMKNLTIVTFVVLPLSLLAGIFGMNTTTTPLVGNPNDFFIIISIMITFAASIFLIFRYSKWL